jgi:hypothetical protein
VVNVNVAVDAVSGGDELGARGIDRSCIDGNCVFAWWEVREGVGAIGPGDLSDGCPVREEHVDDRACNAGLSWVLNTVLISVEPHDADDLTRGSREGLGV